MPSRYLKQYSFPPLFLLIFLLSLRTAEACSCGPRSTVLDAFNHSDVVVIATAVSVEKTEPEKTDPPDQTSDREYYLNGIKSTSMRVEQVFKGTLKVGDEMILRQGNGANCVWTFDEEAIGEKFLFYLSRPKNSSRWVAITCGRSGQVDNAGDDLLFLNNLNKVRNKTRISGTLSFRYETGESPAGRKIRIIGTRRTQEIKTDDNGVYEIYDLPAGRYFIEPEIPRGWKVARYWVGESPSLDRNADYRSLERIAIILEANKHAALDLMLDVDNVIRGHIYDPLGQPMKDVCLDLVPADGSEGAYQADCTKEDGAFALNEIPPGDYVIMVNKDGKMTSSEPFGTFYYPTALKREEATVFNINLGDIFEKLEIYPPIVLKTITVEGVWLYSDGKPVADQWVSFEPVRKESAENKDENGSNDSRAKTDLKGRFSIKIVQGANGSLFGGMYSYVGRFANCPKHDRLVKQAGHGEIKTPPLEIRATTNLYGVELKFPFPSCKKANTSK